MLYKLWRLIQLFLPYGLIIHMYKKNKALQANIKTRTGKNLKAIMVTEKYGLLFTEKDYVSSRIKKLKEQQELANKLNEMIAEEMNSLSTEARELFFNEQI